MARMSCVRWFGFGFVVAVANVGCSHFMETRSVARFADALEAKDKQELKAATTANFHDKALRHTKSLEDFQVLNLPDGKINVIKVIEDGKDRRKVNVTVGERKQKLQFELTRDKKSGSWLVDDVRTPKKRNGLVVARSVAEQMDLLLTAREFLEACSTGDRDDVLKACTPELSGSLKVLSPKALSAMVKPIAGTKSERSKQKPRATLDGPAALIVLNRKSGKLLMKLAQIDDKWKIADVAMESLKDSNHINSLHKQAVVVRTTRQFLAAYHASDKKQLAALCTTKLYRESLRYAKLSDFPLPAPASEGKLKFDVTLKGGKANAVLTDGDASMIRITLTEVKPGKDEKTDKKDYRVEDVARYRRNSRTETRISSFYVSRAWAKEFALALATGDLGILKKASTSDFNRRVWRLADKNLMREMPVMGLTSPRIEIESTTHHGPVTEILAKQGQLDTTWVLREHEGRVRVDDVKVIEYGKPKSLKAYLELAIPIARFRRGIREKNLSELQQNSSEGLNRLVWRQTRGPLPNSAIGAIPYLAGKVNSIAKMGDNYIVSLGGKTRGARIHLVEEKSRYVVDDVTLIGGTRPTQRAQLKQRLRMELATSTKLSKAGNGNRHASYSTLPPSNGTGNDRLWGKHPRRDSGMRHAVHTDSGNGSTYSVRNMPKTPIVVDPGGSAFSDPVGDSTMR